MAHTHVCFVALWTSVWNLDVQQKDQRQTAGIWDVLLLKDPMYQLDRGKTNCEICEKLVIENDLLQRAIRRKLRLFGHICRMEDYRKLKTLMFGIVDGMNERGRPCRKWMDDIVSWCKTGLQELNMETHYKTSNGHQWMLVPWFLKGKKRQWVAVASAGPYANLHFAPDR